MLVCYDLPADEAKQLHDSPYPWTPTDHAITEVIGPGCTVCKMVFEEAGDRPCPGERPKELDDLRGVGNSEFAGLPRSERRKMQHRKRKAERVRG